MAAGPVLLLCADINRFAFQQCSDHYGCSAFGQRNCGRTWQELNVSLLAIAIANGATAAPETPNVNTGFTAAAIEAKSITDK